MARTLEETLKRAHALLQEHGLDSWKVGLENRASRAGVCFFQAKVIKLSKKYILSPNVTDAEVDDTILHEIAHALAGPSVPSHGEEWKKIASSIGCSAKTCVPTFVDPKWRITCPCGKVNFPRYQARRKWAACRACNACRQPVSIVPYMEVIDLTGDD